MKGKHYTVGWYLQQKLYLHFYNYDDILILLFFFFFNYNDKTAKEQIDLSFPLSWTANSSCRLVQGGGDLKEMYHETVRTAGTPNWVNSKNNHSNLKVRINNPANTKLGTDWDKLEEDRKDFAEWFLKTC